MVGFRPDLADSRVSFFAWGENIDLEFYLLDLEFYIFFYVFSNLKWIDPDLDPTKIQLAA